MNFWVKNSIKNLLPLSEEKNDFKLALQEWFFSGEIIDYGDSRENCQLCEKDELRYHFEIKNKLNNSLWVGSSCIEKFDITIYDDYGIEVTENKNAYLQNQARIKHVKNVFSALLKTGSKGQTSGKPNKELDNHCVNKFNLEGKLDARMLNYLFKRFDEEGIFYEKRFFKISLKSEESKEKLLKLSLEQFDRIKKALTIPQRKFYEDNKKLN